MPTPKPSAKLTRLASKVAEPGSATPLDLVEAIRELRPALDTFERRCVQAARKEEKTWDQIGAAAGVHRQNANRKWGRRV